MKRLIGIGEPLAHQLSCLTGVILWTGFTLLVWNKLKINLVKEAVIVGAGWFIATMLVETFVLNRRLSWEQILETYNLGHGQLWGLVLLWVGFMPVVIFLAKKP